MKKDKSVKTGKRQTMGKESLLERICIEIRKHKSPSGSSLAYLKKTLGCDSGASKSKLTEALKKAVQAGTLIQEKSSYRLPGEVYEAPAEEKVEITDVEVGSGPAAKSGDKVTMKYVGKLDDGTQFDSGDRFKFTIDAGEVIKGWDAGIKGMCKGGTRELVIPPKLGYGKRGSAPDIPPDATLHFTVTLISLS